MKLTNSFYNVLKSIAMVWLPGAGTLYFALAQIWHLPHGAEVVGSITAIDTFLGAGLAAASAKYSPPVDGKFNVDRTDLSRDVFQIEMHTPLANIDKKDHVLLEVANKKLT